MHSCPTCGQACYCSGDIDDCPSETADWVYENCTHCQEDEPLDDQAMDQR